MDSLDWFSTDNFIQEIDGVKVNYVNENNGAKTISFKQISKQNVKPISIDFNESFINVDDFVDVDVPAKASKSTPKIIEKIIPIIEEQKMVELDQNGPDISKWEEFRLSPFLLKGLQDLGFTYPTDIQKRSLPFTLSGKRDILGAASTGSGKTLAFGLPILQSLISTHSSKMGFHSLILVPTRELALQVSDHLKKVSAHFKCRIITIIGGLSQQKQVRQIESNPSIIVATPGRLWDLCKQDPTLTMKLSAIRYLVLDEADRMLEPGHFKDLDSLLESLSPVVVLDDEVRKKATKKKNAKHVRRTFLFSATLLPEKALKDDGKFRKTPKKIVNKSNIRGSEGNVIPTISDLVQKLDFSDNNPVYINLVEQKITANGIMESKIECLAKDKDAYLYYILSRYVGRTIVFVNSIDSIRRIVPLLTLLKVKCWGIHAEMQQRQRLKNLENFSKCVDGILISSDVSARGLDINSIDHVIHYHLPRTADLFVHRSGRTGRGSKEGVVVALIAPPEVKVLRRILHGLDRSDDMAVFPVDHDVMSQIKERVALANAVDEQEHKLSKLSHEKSWLKTTAMDMDLIVDESSYSLKKIKDKIKSLKNTLDRKLEERIIPKGISLKYLTTGKNENLAQVLMGNSGSNTLMPSKKRSLALSDLKALKEKAFKKIK